MARESDRYRKDAHDVAIVGAGVAGLCAARRLGEAGRRVVLFEARDEIGGAAQAGWLTSGADRAWLRFLDAAGLRDEALAPVHAFHLRAAGALVSTPTEGALPPGYGSPIRLARFGRVLASMGRELDLEFPERAARWDDRCLRDFADLYLGPRGATRWLEPWLAARSPVDAATTSRVAALLALAERRDAPVAVLQRAPSRADPRWVGNTEVLCGAPVDRIERIPAVDKGRGGAGVVLFCRGQRFEARAAILAIAPADVLGWVSKLWSAPERRALAAFGVRDSVGWHTEIETLPSAWNTSGSIRSALIRVARTQSPLVASLFLDAQRRFLRIRLRGSARPQAAELKAHLRQLLPEIAVASATSSTVHQPSFEVGAYRRIARARRLLASSPGVFFCGDAWSEATLEGAARSGWRAGGDALHFLASSPASSRISV